MYIITEGFPSFAFSLLNEFSVNSVCLSVEFPVGVVPRSICFAPDRAFVDCLVLVSSAVHQGVVVLKDPRVSGQEAIKQERSAWEINSCLALRSSAVKTGLNQKG
jgi:hypothetical protein